MNDHILILSITYNKTNTQYKYVEMCVLTINILLNIKSN